MLVSLHVKNMALIREEEVVFGEGLNILSGETGAGKSIIIGSVNVALGTGKFGDYVPENAEYALTELVFDTDSPAVLSKLSEADIPVEDGQVVISRKYQKGRSVSRVNGETVPVTFVRELASDLIDIHGQHQHQSLLYPKFHLALVDRHAEKDLQTPMEKYRTMYAEFRNVCSSLADAVTDESEQARALDLARYELKEIEEADLRPGEDEELEEDFRLMENGQKILEALGQTDQLLTGDSGAADGISRAVRELSSVASLDPALSELNDQLAETENLLNDFTRSLTSYMDDFRYDEESFYAAGQRLDLINHLKSRYGRTIPEILDYAEAQRGQIEKLENYEAYLADLQRRKEILLKNLQQLAEQITEVRRVHAKVLEEAVTQALIDLNFLDVRFGIDFKLLDKPGAEGMDEICFLISTNPGMPMRPLQDTASGGELSRIMLAIKSVMADQDEIGTLIFDEIDTGISGRTAQKVSEKMAMIAGKHQVICITHLAQIAAMADSHYVISKHAEDGVTATTIRLLQEEESAEELARIIGGVSITDEVRSTAEQMRKMALQLKNQLAEQRR